MLSPPSLAVDQDKNPNTSYADGCVVMESVFLFAIPAAPRPHLTEALTAHIYQAVGLGFREDHGLPVSVPLLSAQARLYLGHEYADAIGLPRATWLHTLLAVCRLLVFRAFYAPYFLLPARGARSGLGAIGAAFHSLAVRAVYHCVMRTTFAALVKGVRARQPTCRFGNSVNEKRDPDQVRRVNTTPEAHRSM